VTRLRRTLGIGKAAEHGADRVALGLLAAAGYPPAELGKAISRLGPMPNHPPVADRLAELAKAPPPPKNLK
jgi:predicted Zn-dependent protease